MIEGALAEFNNVLNKFLTTSDMYEKMQLARWGMDIADSVNKVLRGVGGKTSALIEDAWVTYMGCLNNVLEDPKSMRIKASVAENTGREDALWVVMRCVGGYLREVNMLLRVLSEENP